MDPFFVRSFTEHHNSRAHMRVIEEAYYGGDRGLEACEGRDAPEDF